MAVGDSEAFSNPLPPQQDVSYSDEDEDHQPLTNADFRKLLMTPRPSAGSKSGPEKPVIPKEVPKVKEEEDAATRRKKKKMYFAKLKKLEEERNQELAEKYRDRARERRDGSNKDYDETEIASTTADYRAVAPDAKAGETYMERRKQLIQESKYLGGDMEHTHLVKGLDYALLEKVRAEITNKEQEEEDEMDEVVNKTEEEPQEVKKEERIEFKTKTGRNIYRQLFHNKHPERNELFLPGRMAYVVELEDEGAETDIPTTLIRSKADCPQVEATTTLSTNDIVINKLTQILSYLRQGRRDKKRKLKDKNKLKDGDKKMLDEGIYGDLGEYMPSYGKPKKEEKEVKKDKSSASDRHDRRDRHDRHRDDRRRDRGDRDDRGERDTHGDREERGDRDRDQRGDRDAMADRDKKKSYFEKPVDEDEELRNVKDRMPSSAKDFVQAINSKYGGSSGGKPGWAGADPTDERGEERPKKLTKEDERMAKIKRKTVVDSYAECYPGFAEADDAIVESDEEVDFTKMDPGNKKGPVSRWDFETAEEYSDYMSNKEALPKAAFQYGVKMADGRRTRRAGPKDEKKALDREWQKIQNIMQKRKQMGTGEGPREKASKY